jgi:hypothetical protein
VAAADEDPVGDDDAEGQGPSKRELAPPPPPRWAWALLPLANIFILSSLGAKSAAASCAVVSQSPLLLLFPFTKSAAASLSHAVLSLSPLLLLLFPFIIMVGTSWSAVTAGLSPAADLAPFSGVVATETTGGTTAVVMVSSILFDEHTNATAA